MDLPLDAWINLLRDPGDKDPKLDPPPKFVSPASENSLKIGKNSGKIVGALETKMSLAGSIDDVLDDLFTYVPKGADFFSTCFV